MFTDNHNPQRRKLLRGTLATACAVWLTRSIGAENTTRKLSRSQAKYQEQPKADQKCASCLHFLPDTNTCKLVEGKISPDGWCMLWTKKQA